MTIDEAVRRDPEIMSGELCFTGTRVPVKNLFDHLEAGHPLSEFFDGFPRVNPDQVHAVLERSYRSLLSDIEHRNAA